MSESVLRQEIIKVVVATNGCKSTDLIAKLPKEVIISDSFGNYHDIIDDLIREGELVKLEYTILNSNYRIRSILFPKGTIILGE
jgi:AmiR/NasT family two-component response regulator